MGDLTGPVDGRDGNLKEGSIKSGKYSSSDFCPDCLVNFALGDLFPLAV